MAVKAAEDRLTLDEVQQIVRLWVERGGTGRSTVDAVADALPIPRREVLRLLREVRADAPPRPRSAGYLTLPVIGFSFLMLLPILGVSI